MTILWPLPNNVTDDSLRGVSQDRLEFRLGHSAFMVAARARQLGPKIPRNLDIPLSLYGLTFEEALAATMQVKPPPREAPKKKRSR